MVVVGMRARGVSDAQPARPAHYDRFVVDRVGAGVSATLLPLLLLLLLIEFLKFPEFEILEIDFFCDNLC